MGWRAWALRLVLMVAAPLAVLGIAELALRLAGYGYPTDLFLRGEGGQYVINERFGWRFFPRGLAREPVLARFPARKAAGTYRVFILGGSAAQGVPNPVFSFGRALEAMLREQYPGVPFEVVNTAMTAVNSHVVREIARECAAYEPDLFVVYMGNNEVVGPYGPGTVFGGYRPNRTVIRAAIWARATCLGQWMADLAEHLGPGPSVRSQWAGMEMFLANRVSADDPRLEATYEHFGANLADVCAAARAAGARTLLCTVVTNLRDCPPFASVHRPDLGEADAARWQEAYEAAAALEEAGNPEQALAGYGAAAAIDETFADLHFRLARCHLALGRTAEARLHFTRARDLDALRFRADTRINAIIRQAAPSCGAGLVDAEDLFASHPDTPHGIPGDEWLYEHVHLTYGGNYLLARAVLEKAAGLLPEGVRARAASPVPPSPERCAELLVLSGPDVYVMARDMEKMTSRPPFTAQLDHARQQARRRSEVQALKARWSAESVRAAVEACRRALERTPEDCLLRGNLARLLDGGGDFAAAADEWRALLARCPEHVSTRIAMGVSLMRAGRAEDAVGEFRAVLQKYPANAAALRNCGDALMLTNRTDEAIAQYREALRVKPDYADAHSNLAAALALQKKPEEAIAHFEEAMRLAPDPVGHYNLGNLLARQGRDLEAMDHFRRALALEPDDPALVDGLRKRLEFLEARQGRAGP